jgi:hypothetical protein
MKIDKDIEEDSDPLGVSEPDDKISKNIEGEASGGTQAFWLLIWMAK